MAPADSETNGLHVTLIGAGTIGLSLAALHLTHLPCGSSLTIVDVRPDLESYVKEILPTYLPEEFHERISSVHLTPSVEEGVKGSSIIQESGPEDPKFKMQLWHAVEKHAPLDALLWTSTSGIPASVQIGQMQDKSRLLVVHPFNPPHILPLLEIVPSPYTSQKNITRTMDFWKGVGREPILLAKEVTGFVAGRLAWALLREAIHLVDQGIVTVEQLDRIMETSMGPRWAYAGPFKSFHVGGGPGGLRSLFKNIGGTIQACWDEEGNVNFGDGWEETIFAQTERYYGGLDLKKRDAANQGILEIARQFSQDRNE
jgi:3-hydroxyacyl-CoA dehydrogenase